ncbi:MAG: sigma-70 family RNA polymerase sigma factor [Cyclobacteriaceae bacterium]|nr:sigma-70 family RNA polymerase sigma factor [Cyclobacteriaceae bacterium]MCX7637331.1 sigma-70 family RNA polymerase sigma factor [Cyclobacteriaceae bacterium]MDW8330414.1 sigma-70 family RNA polymerase sigma factor [Cyclobacteriaceae bacterium]
MQQAFTELIQQHRGIIFKVIRLYVNHPEDEKDLYQEILYQAWKSYPRFDGRSKFSTWLYRVSLNTVLTFKRRPAVIDRVDDLEKVGGTTEQHEHHEDTAMLYRAIRDLNEIDRMLITLHLDGYDNEEIAGIAGITKNHVAVKLHRIKEALIKKLKNM